MCNDVDCTGQVSAHGLELRAESCTGSIRALSIDVRPFAWLTETQLCKDYVLLAYVMHVQLVYALPISHCRCQQQTFAHLMVPRRVHAYSSRLPAALV